MWLMGWLRVPLREPQFLFGCDGQLRMTKRRDVYGQLRDARGAQLHRARAMRRHANAEKGRTEMPARGLGLPALTSSAA